jgi:MFS superfamily sulfate permease-like transporter
MRHEYARLEADEHGSMHQLDERSSHVSKRNMTWLAAVLAIGVLGWIAVGIVVGLLAAATMLVVSEVVERRARTKRRTAARESTSSSDNAPQRP